MIELMLFGALLAILFVGGLIADYVFPKIGFIERFIESLPMCREEDAE